jgi:sporulation protein YlmC with PRC-barrel domain
LPVANAQGTHLGEVTDLEIDVQGGRLIAMMVHKGGVLGVGGKTLTIDSSAIRGIGEKLVTVEMSLDESAGESG